MKKKRKKKSTHQYLLLKVLLCIFIVFFVAIVSFGIYVVLNAPEFDDSLLYTKQSTIILDRNQLQIARLGSENREVIEYRYLPQVLIDAVVATEDSRFFQHNGFDIARFIKAVSGHLEGNSGAGGASTITMQLSKNAFTSTEAHGIEGIVRKFTDIYLSIFKIERAFTKQEIIEYYVNEPFLGSNSYGVEQASQTYFGKPAKQMNLAEASIIAGLFQAPGAYDPYQDAEAAEARRSTVLSLMVRHGYITEEEKQIAESIKVKDLLQKKN